MLGKSMGVAAVILGVFAVVGAGLVGVTYEGTKERIAENERQALLDNLHELIPQSVHDNDMFTDVIQVTDTALLGVKGPTNVYRARKAEQPVAAVIAVESPNGYSGTIKLLVAVNYNGKLAGVRVVSHKETPGLGDNIEIRRSDWILGFNGSTLIDPNERGWEEKKDGGVFDQFTGATITPRAIVGAVHNTLRYFDKNKAALFEVSQPDKGEG